MKMANSEYNEILRKRNQFFRLLSADKFRDDFAVEESLEFQLRHRQCGEIVIRD